MAAHTTNLAHDNLPTAANVAYLEARARGGAGLVITEGIRVRLNSAARSLALGGFDDRAVAGFQQIADAVHAAGAVVFGQLLHIGREGAAHPQVVAADAVSVTDWAPGRAIAHEMTTAEVASLPAAYAAAAERLAAGGFDGVEVHIGHGHLLHQFLSPVSNRRRDRYGGSASARTRILIEIVAAIAERCPDLTLGVRVSAHEFLDGGMEPQDAIQAVQRIHAERPLDFINVSHSAAVPEYSMSTQIADMAFPTAPFRAFPGLFKRAFPDVPVLAACRYDDPDIAADMVASGETDLVGLARAHIADPDVVAKWQSGRTSEVRRCIACNVCIGRTTSGLPIRCVVNPEAGTELAWSQMRRARHPAASRVLVVGGGPAGMAAAAAAGRAGHAVTLFESDDQLGGRLRLGARMHSRRGLQLMLDDLTAELTRQRVQVELGHTFDFDSIALSDYDQLIVATGARPHRAMSAALTADEVIQEPSRIVGRVAIVDDDGGYAGAGLAEHLAHEGHAVVIVTRHPTIAWRVPTSSQPGLFRRLKELDVDRRVNVTAELEGSSLRLTDHWNQDVTTLSDIGTVVYAHPGVGGTTGPLPAERVEVVGDALAPLGLLHAVQSGALAGTAPGLPDGVRQRFEIQRGL